MAVPKRKTSKARRDQRRANWKISAPALVECPQCHAKKLAHYDGEQVIVMDKDEK